MSDLTALFSLAGSAFLVIGAIGVGLLYLRTNYVKERDQVRTDTIDGLRELAETRDALCDAEKAERDNWIGRLLHHHRQAHPRCQSLPDRDG